ncbi:MAG: hypothetical protein PVF29_07865 [Desulfobacterales bacterium]|jgi:hypothetical protein
MAQHVIASNRFGNKYRHLRKADGHLRAEIRISRNDLGYQFKLQEINDHQGCFFINENSAVLNILDVGTVLDMKYWTAEKIRLVKYVRAQIKNITRQKHEPFKGHYKVGLSILQMKGSKRVNPTDRLLKARAEAEALLSV